MLLRAGYPGRTTRRSPGAAPFVPDFPASQTYANVTATGGGGGTASTSFTAFSAVSVPAGALALYILTFGSSTTPTISGSGDTDWTTEGTATQSTVNQTLVYSWFNNTGISQNRTLIFTFSGSRSPRGLLLVIPRTTSGAVLDVAFAGANQSGTTPDPPSLDLGVSRKALWIATASGSGNAVNATASPTTPGTWDGTGYQNLAASSSGTNPTSLAVIQQFSEAQTLNPGTYTLSANVNWTATTIAVFET